MKHASLPLLGWMAPLQHLGAKMPVGQKPTAKREPSMNEITTIGLDLAKHVFQVTPGRGNDSPSPRGCRRNFISAGVQPAAEVLLG